MRTDDWNGRHIVICSTTEVSHRDAGGIDLWSARVAARFTELGARVTVLTERALGSYRRSDTGYGTIRRLGRGRSYWAGVLVWMLWHRPRIDAVVEAQREPLLFTPLVLSRRVPVLAVIHETRAAELASATPRWLGRLLRTLRNELASAVYGERAVCVVAPSVRRVVRRELGVRGPIYLCPRGQDVSVGIRERSEQPEVVYVGPLAGRKRLHLLVAAFRTVADEYPTAKLHLVGAGPWQPRLEHEVRELRLENDVVFHGHLSYERKEALLGRAWLFASPSDEEGCGTTVIEAAAAGVPAVAYRASELREAILDGRTGWLASDDGTLGKTLVEAIATLGDAAAAERWSQECQAWARRFSWTAAGDRVLGVLASEEERLGHPLLDRREVSDVATVVEVPRGAFAAEMLSRLRRQDQMRVNSSLVEVLFHGADETGALRALVRIGFPVELIRSMRVARSGDLIGWDLDGAAVRLATSREPSSLADELASVRSERSYRMAPSIVRSRSVS